MYVEQKIQSSSGFSEVNTVCTCTHRSTTVACTVVAAVCHRSGEGHRGKDKNRNMVRVRADADRG